MNQVFVYLYLILLSIFGSIKLNAAAENIENSNLQPLIEIKKINFQGNTVFNDRELRRIITPFENNQVTLERLLRVRVEITDYYTSKGYQLTGAFIPAQDLTSGKINIYILEGTIEQIVFSENTNVNTNYILARLPKVEEIYNINSLSKAIEKLQNDSYIKSIDVEVTGNAQGQVNLLVNAQASSRLRTNLAFSNIYAPNIGRNGGQVDLQLHGIGMGDILALSWAKTEGLDRYSGGYSIPINQYDTKLLFQYTKANSELIDDLASELDINADFNSYQFGVSQPILSSKSQKLALELNFNLINSESFILDDFSFAFVDGLEDGESKISELSLVQSYLMKNSELILSFQSSFNLGLNIFDATQTDLGRDSLYWYWQGEVEMINQINDRLIYITDIGLQLSPDQLLPIKQFSIGGINSVRGYRQNYRNGDNGIFISSELQYSLFKLAQSELKLISFLEAGTTWNNKVQSEDNRNNELASIGVGFQYLIAEYLNFQLDYGMPLINVEEAERNSSSARTNLKLLLSF